jgi:hypothetical protein
MLTPLALLVVLHPQDIIIQFFPVLNLSKIVQCSLDGRLNTLFFITELASSLMILECVKTIDYPQFSLSLV